MIHQFWQLSDPIPEKGYDSIPAKICALNQQRVRDKP
jgi:hypothetical protein